MPLEDRLCNICMAYYRYGELKPLNGSCGFLPTEKVIDPSIFTPRRFRRIVQPHTLIEPTGVFSPLLMSFPPYIHPLFSMPLSRFLTCLLKFSWWNAVSSPAFRSRRSQAALQVLVYSYAVAAM
jgi:hypothetical protein